MKKYLGVFIVCVGAIVIVAIYVVSGFARQNSVDKNGIGRLTSGPQALLQIGMTEPQVMSLLGKPGSAGVYPKFEHKTAQQWQVVQAKADSVPDSTVDSGVAVNAGALKARIQLTHRFHDEWTYTLKNNDILELYFGEDGRLLHFASAPVLPKADGGNSKSNSAARHS